jgi:uncharacterized protein YegL
MSKQYSRESEMGFAKYMEDNYSRYHGTSIVRGREHEPFARRADTYKEEKKAGQMKEQTSKLKDFTVAEARPMPVIVMADVSGSMSVDGKIEALNLALKNMIAGFAAESRVRAEIQVGLITFGGEDARVHLPLAPAHRISEISPLVAAGRTPMGSAFEHAKKLVEDKEMISSRAYRPVFVLVSDGMPTDDWEPMFNALCQSERGQKATRFAMAIGADADVGMLERFANDPESPVFKAHEARDIHRFFRAVTMSVAARSQSAALNSNVPLMLAEIPDDDDLDLDF